MPLIFVSNFQLATFAVTNSTHYTNRLFSLPLQIQTKDTDFTMLNVNDEVILVLLF